MKHRKTSESDSTAAESASCEFAAELFDVTTSSQDDDVIPMTSRLFPDNDVTVVPCNIPSNTRTQSNQIYVTEGRLRCRGF